MVIFMFYKNTVNTFICTLLDLKFKKLFKYKSQKIGKTKEIRKIF